MIAEKTHGARHFLARLLIPVAYENAREFPRPMIKFIHEKLDGPLVGVEIGVMYGKNAESILKTVDMEHLFLIDPFDSYFTCKGTELFPSLIQSKERLAKFDGKTTFIVKCSMDAVNEVPNNLDFVYVDGDHNYPGVKKDIELYYPKVRNGGVFGGHDFGVDFPGVVDAVMEFVDEKDICPRSSFSKNSDWWIIKNEG